MIYHSIFSACLAWYLIEILHWHKYFDFLTDSKPMDIKPFNCVVCLSAWAGFVTGLVVYQSFAAIEVGFIAGVMGALLDNGTKRYL